MKAEQNISNTLLHESVRFKIQISTPGILPIVGIKTLRLGIKDLYLGTLLKIAPKITRLKIEITNGPESLPQLLSGMQGNIQLQSEIITMAILNSPVKIALWGWLLKRFLIWNLDAKSLSQLSTVMLDKMNIVDFMTSIVSIGGLQVLKNETSLQGDTGEKIAPGTGSDQ